MTTRTTPGTARRALITGGAGFIGSHLCERLLSRGQEVLCVDNLFTGRKENVVHLLDNPYFEFLRHDVCFPLYVEVDEIYNLACPASPISYQRDPVQTAKTSVMGAINMLGLAKRLRIRVLQASTSEVYGDPTVHPQREDYWGNVNPIGPRACYDEGKRCAETLFFDYRRQLDLDIKVVRIFNTYGPRMRPGDGRVVGLGEVHQHIVAPSRVEARENTPQKLAANLGAASAASHGIGLETSKHLGIGDDRRIVCGISFGYADDSHPINQYRTSRAAVSDVVDWRR